MVAILTLLLILTLSLIATRIASVALVHTGLSREVARFQARSAFTGVGFTTNESEMVINHPVRRKILQLLMLWGNAGLVTAVASTIASLMQIERSETPWTKIFLLLGGVITVYLLSSSKWVDELMFRWISVALKRFTDLEVNDYAGMLQLGGDYTVTQFLVDEEDWLVRKPLEELDLRSEGVLVLGILRSTGSYLGGPRGDTIIYPGDNVVVYGRRGIAEALVSRRRSMRGDVEHHQVVSEQKRVQRIELETDEDELDAPGPLKATTPEDQAQSADGDKPADPVPQADDSAPARQPSQSQ